MNHPKHILPGEPIPRDSIFHERRYRVTRLLAPPLNKNNLLLDIGCGNAGQTEYFAGDVGQAYGIDLQHERLPGFQRELVEHKIPNISLMGGNGEFLPFRDGVFDCITCFEVLEHVEDPGRVLSEIRRVLKPDGIIFLSIPNRWWIFETHGADLPLLPWNRVPFFSWLPKRIHDAWARARIYTRKEIKALVGRCGFSEIEMRLLTAPMDVVKVGWLQKALRRTVFRGDTTSIPLLASTIFVYAKKSS
jgi:ubiquinone/menaquinone biosynthesis C-methylase UbiE